ncbi:hypothetical protein VHTUMSATKI_06070 [Vibrio harveyi]
MPSTSTFLLETPTKCICSKFETNQARYVTPFTLEVYLYKPKLNKRKVEFFDLRNRELILVLRLKLYKVHNSWNHYGRTG